MMPYGNYYDPNSEPIPYREQQPYQQYGASGAFPGTTGPYGQGTGAAGGGVGGGGAGGLGGMLGGFGGGGGGEGGGGGGMSGGMWMAIIEKILGRIEGRKQTRAQAEAARAGVPSNPTYLLPFIEQMKKEGEELKNSELNPRMRAAANVSGERAALARGLSGPLAASVQNQSVNEATDAYNVWRRSALQDARERYMQLVSQYMNSLEARRQAQIRAGFAEREAYLSQLPLGPVGQSIGREGIRAGWWNPEYKESNITNKAAYTAPDFGAF